MWRGASKHAAEAVDASRPLAERLLEITANVHELVPAEALAPGERAVVELEASGIEQRILPPGAAAPEFALADQRGALVHSRELVARGPLLLNFFRGRWCPYCVAELETWQALLPQVAASGASLVGISPQTERHNDFTAQQHQLTFPLLSDAGNNVARRFGLAYRVPEYLLQHYRRIFINLPHLNGDAGGELPLPATYLVGRDGRVAFAQAYADFKRRPEPQRALAAARSC